MRQDLSDNMREIEELLEKIGLTEKEAKVYLAGSANGPLSVKALVEITGIKRPTVYHCLETLEEKGLTACRSGYEGRTYVMSKPKLLGKILEKKREVIDEQEKQIQDFLPLIAGLSADHKRESMQTTQYTGEAGIKTAIDEALYCKSREWMIVAPSENFLSESNDKKFAQYYLDTRKARKIQSRTLWEQDRGVLSKSDHAMRNPRILPKAFQGKFTSMMIIYDSSVLLISSRRSMSAVIIESREIADLLQAFFEGLWAISTPKK